MPLPEPICDLSQIDLSKILAGPEQIRGCLPHRYEMEMLSAIVHIDSQQKIIVGYKDIGTDEFWIRGHFPKRAVFPGVLMCEAGAQLSAFYTFYLKVAEGKLMGLGGIDNARFRRGVYPGERLVLVGKGNRVTARMTNFTIQGYVNTELAFHADIIGVSLGPLEGS